ncbi:MAG: class I SAM-dependent DNA methyltransferase [Holophagaceae bacterium]|nr:class I SAM-dependent DNA methyltransferase [Holophagaceae bacterium]
MPRNVRDFITRWQAADGPERGNMQLFLHELIQTLDLPQPEPTGASSGYCFEKQVPNYNPEGKFTKNYMDLYKAGCFILEAKRTSDALRAQRGSGGGGGGKGQKPMVHAPGLPGLIEEPRTPGYRANATYDAKLEAAFIQGIRYAMALGLQGPPPPFLIVCDIGHSFHIWNRYDPKAGGGYGGFGARRIIMLEELEDPEIQTYFRTIWTNPKALDTSRLRAQVTRGIAQELGELAKELQSATRSKDEVAHFLMRCVFTCFAEDIGLLPGKPFTEGLRHLEKDPDEAHAFLQGWWKVMDEGGKWGWEKVLRFNGGLFKDTSVPPLSQAQIALLRLAAEKDWRDVEPAIFGTLLESALEDDERHRLGAHYTPRAYIQRLVDATFGQELRRQWTEVEDELAGILEQGNTEAAVDAAKAKLRAFHQHLATLQFLDPACGSGNFLYVAFDTLKRLEGEVLRRMEELGEWFSALELSHERISPAQFKGIEINPWAAGIAELVLWIAYLQWFRHNHPAGNPPEPVLQNYGSIEQRDAVLDFDGEEATGTSRWDGKTTKLDARGREVPDDTARAHTTRLLNPRPALWPQADYIIGNPPFLGNASMLGNLGVGYTEALRAAYPEVPDTVDFVLYWWHKAALAVRSGRTQRFGLITTNSLRQVRQRGVIEFHLSPSSLFKNRINMVNRDEGDKGDDYKPLKLLWAIPDHPWHGEGAAVRIAMTVAGLEGSPVLARVVSEPKTPDPEHAAAGLVIEEAPVDSIHEDLSGGARVADAMALKANDGLASRGMQLIGSGFIVTPAQWKDWKRPTVVHPYRNGRDLTDHPREVMVIDLYGLAEEEVRKTYPAIYQHLLQTVKPEREENNDSTTRKNWWIFGRNREEIRPALKGLSRFIATVETSKHRTFQFLDGATVPDNMIVVIASGDALHLGILSSRFHVVWALAVGALLGVGNTPRYSKSRCFDPFPFPDATKAQAARIRDLAEELDAHRKRAQALGLGITAQYNLLERLRSGEPLTEKEQATDAQGLVSLLLALHQKLDAAVAEAYGWDADLSEPDILERLVALNQARALEEAKGKVRWLRPDYQAPHPPTGNAEKQAATSKR